MGRGANKLDVEDVARFSLDYFPDRNRHDDLQHAISEAYKHLGDLDALAEDLFSDPLIAEYISESSTKAPVKDFFQTLLVEEVSRGVRDYAEFAARIYLTLGLEGSRTLFGSMGSDNLIHVMPDLKTNITACRQDLTESHYRAISKEKIYASPMTTRCEKCNEVSWKKNKSGSATPTPPYIRSAIAPLVTRDTEDAEKGELSALMIAASDTAYRATKYSGEPREILDNLLSFGRMSVTGRIGIHAVDVFSRLTTKTSAMTSFGIHSSSRAYPFFQVIYKELEEKKPVFIWPGKNELLEMLHQATKDEAIQDHEISRARLLALAISQNDPAYADRFLESFRERQQADASMISDAEKAFVAILIEKGHSA
jgi:hypothetical protein